MWIIANDTTLTQRMCRCEFHHSSGPSPSLPSSILLPALLAALSRSWLTFNCHGNEGDVSPEELVVIRFVGKKEEGRGQGVRGGVEVSASQPSLLLLRRNGPPTIPPHTPPPQPFFLHHLQRTTAQVFEPNTALWTASWVELGKMMGMLVDFSVGRCSDGDPSAVPRVQMVSCGPDWEPEKEPLWKKQSV